MFSTKLAIGGLIHLFLDLRMFSLVKGASQTASQPELLDCLLGCPHFGKGPYEITVPNVKFCYDACRLKGGMKGDQMKFGMNTLSYRTARKISSHLRRRKRKGIAPDSGCPAPNGTSDWKPNEFNATFHQYNSKEWYANLSWTPLYDPDDNWTNILVHLHVGDNKVGLGVTCILLPKNSTFLIVDNSSFGWNKDKFIFAAVFAYPHSSISRNMATFHFPRKVPTTPPVEPVPTTPSVEPVPTTPSVEPVPTTPPVEPVPTTPVETDPKENDLVDVAIIVGSLVGLGLVAAAMLAYVLQRKKTIPLPSGFEFHAFIIFSGTDSKWVKNILLPFLEGKHGLKCCVHYRDFIPGRPYVENMEWAVYKSFKTVAVLSRHFLQSDFCHGELQIAMYRLFERRDHSVAAIKIDNIKPRDLPITLRKLSFIDYSSQLERTAWKGKLLDFLAVQENSTSNSSTAAASDSRGADTIAEENNNGCIVALLEDGSPAR